MSLSPASPSLRDEARLALDAVFAPHWGWIALRGVAAILFGLMAWLAPGLTLAVLVLAWGAYALVDGVLALVAGFRMRDNGRPLWSVILLGLLSIAAGVVTFLWPGLTALTLVLIIGIWAIAVGLCQIVAAIRLRKEIEGEWLLGLSGALSVLFGIALVVAPDAGALTLAWLIGVFAFVYGVLLLMLALRLRKARRV